MRAVRAAQDRLQRINGVETAIDAADFVVDDAGRAALEASLERALPRDRESLWILEDDGELSVALYLEEHLHDADALAREDLDRYCALLEGVSHLLYVVDRATRERTLTLLELELQAEIDKFLATWQAHHDAGAALSIADLRRRLFVDVDIPQRAAPEETARYVAANRLADRYCGSLVRRFFGTGRLDGLWPEIRRFWRMGHAEKIAHIEAC